MSYEYGIRYPPKTKTSVRLFQLQANGCNRHNFKQPYYILNDFIIRTQTAVTRQ